MDTYRKVTVLSERINKTKTYGENEQINEIEIFCMSNSTQGDIVRVNGEIPMGGTEYSGRTSYLKFSAGNGCVFSNTFTIAPTTTGTNIDVVVIRKVFI